MKFRKKKHDERALMAGVWTDERRQAARERALSLRIWEKSTGPKTIEGKERSSKNAMKHGMRSAEAVEFRKVMASMESERRDFSDWS